jgi:steroid delta-isomerase-like uncharacterized protein
MSKDIISRYFAAFNAGDVDGMLACLHDDVAHHVNEGNIRRGKTAFAEFCAHMNRCYRENLTDMVIFANDDGSRGAAEFIVNGTYLETDGDLPAARGQSYRLPAGSFFSITDGQISRVVTYYNLSDWIAQVS